MADELVHAWRRETSERTQRRSYGPPLRFRMYRVCCQCGWATRWVSSPDKARVEAIRGHGADGQLSLVLGADASS